MTPRLTPNCRATSRMDMFCNIMRARVTVATLEYAQKYRSVGLNLLPIRSDGSKAPALKEWRHLQERPMTEEEFVTNFSNGNGIAATGGAISGNLEDFDFDDVDI